MIRVMHVLNTGSYSGAENVVITLINATKGKVDSTYVSLNGPIKEYLSENGIRFAPVKKLTVPEIRRVIAKVKPDIIHAHDFTAGIICSLATGLPVINHIHNNSPWIKHYNLRSFAYAASCFRYKRILTVSDSVMNEYVFGKLFEKKTKIVGNPIDPEKVRKQAGQADISFDIAFLGRLSEPKNPMLFLDIIKTLKSRLPELKVIMIGDGELREEVKKQIGAKGLNKNITMTGFQKNPYKYLNQARLLLMPSSWEGYGLAAVEALALGKPVVCSDKGGLPKIVDSSCGRICHKTEDYCKAVYKLLTDSSEYNRMVSGSLERAKKIENLKEYSGMIFREYRKIIRSTKGKT